MLSSSPLNFFFVGFAMKIERHMKRLDEDLNQFAEALKQGTTTINKSRDTVPDFNPSKVLLWFKIFYTE